MELHFLYCKVVMDKQLLLICALTFIIHIIGTLAYSVRIAGIRTRRIAVSLALFSILMLLSRTSNSFLGPFLAKRVETGIDQHVAASTLLLDFRWLLFSASLATIVGAINDCFKDSVSYIQESVNSLTSVYVRNQLNRFPRMKPP